MPSGVVGMLAPSPTAMQPPATRKAASAPVSSFWVADGIATSQGTSQTLRPGTKTASPPRRVAYTSSRARSTCLTCLSRSRSMPFSSTT